ncbi:MAG: glutamate racemase [Bacteroidales bacterium]|nr:glutamate racemase [Bacteroidales bacterium]
MKMGKIGVFDSGYGGLTILGQLRRRLPRYDYAYLGDNARAPYGTRSFDVVYEFTLQAVKRLIDMDCPLIILACNTASAKALRTIQQTFIANERPDCRVLGVIRPTAEVVGTLSHNHHIGVLATEGTIRSESYDLEIHKLWSDAVVTGLAAPMWVSLVENGEYDRPGADFFVRDSLQQLLALDPVIDTIILGCTHYPLLLHKIKKFVPPHIRLVPQGEYVAAALDDYLKRHTDLDARLSTGSTCEFFTTESPTRFREQAALFLDNEKIDVQRIQL